MPTETAYQITRLPAAIIRAGANDRTVFNEQELRELADSIRDDGLAQPPTVRPIARGYEIVAGERRFRAMTQCLGWEVIPCIVRGLTDEQASAIMLIENVQRADLDPLDEGTAYAKRIQQFGWTVAQVARVAKVAPKRISARLGLLELVPEAQALVRSGQMPVSFGEAMHGLDANRQRIALRYLAETDRPVLREFKAIVNRLLQDQAQSTLLDLNALMTQTADAMAEHASARHASQHRAYPVADLPAMSRRRNIGQTLEQYLVQLLTSSDPQAQAAAPVVGHVYQQLLRLGLCFAPRAERSPLERQHGSAH